MTLRGGGGLLKPSEYRRMERGELGKSSYNLYWLKKLNSQFLLLYLRYRGEWVG